MLPTAKMVTLRTSFLFVLGALCFVSAYGGLPTKPGVVVRLTKKTFDYATSLGIKEAEAIVSRTKIPNASGKVKFVKYYLYDMKVKDFSIKSHSVAFLPTLGMNYKFADVGLALTGRVHLKAMGFIKMHTSFDIDASRISMGMTLKVAYDNTTGRPTAVAGNCNANVPPPAVTFHGGVAWVLRFFSPRLGRMIKDAVQKQICSDKTMNEVNSRVSKVLDKIPISKNFLNYFNLDVRMLKNPDIQSTYLDSDLKGEVFWQKDHKECPLPVRPMEKLPVTTTKSMTAVQLSAYSLNSFAYVAYKNKYIHYIFDSKNIPKAGLLNTTCQNMCIGKLIPALGKVYPNKTVSVLVEGTEMPEPSIDKGYLLMDSTISVTIYLSTDSPSKPLIIIPVKIHTVSTANIVDEIVHYNISVLKLKLGLVKKGMPIKIDVAQLQHTINFGINAFVMPQINQRGTKGFPLPQSIKGVKMVNTQFQLGVNSAIFMTDFVLAPNLESNKDDDTSFGELLSTFGFPGFKLLSSIANIASDDLTLDI